MLVQGTSPENQRNFGVDPTMGRAMDTPGYHPVHNPNPNPFGFGTSVPMPTTLPMNTNAQGLHGSQFLWDVDWLGSNSSKIRYEHDINVINQPNKPGHLWLWKNRTHLVLCNPDGLPESDSLRLPILTMYMDLWILFPVSRWT